MPNLINAEDESIVEQIERTSTEQRKKKQDIYEDLLNLLAVIHRDGGHYVSKYGIKKAIKDAEQIVAHRLVRCTCEPVSTTDARGYQRGWSRCPVHRNF